MNVQHAHAILSALADWFDECDTLQDGALLFEDDLTIKEHITLALGGMNLPSEGDAPKA